MWDSSPHQPPCLSVYLYFFETGYHCVTLTKLELTVAGLELKASQVLSMFLKDKKKFVTEEMTRQLRAHSALVEDLSWVPQTQTRWHTATCTSISRGSNNSSLLGHLHL